MSFVLDASVALAWCLDEVQADRTRPILAAMETETAVVPALWPIEVAHALAVNERRGRLDEARISRFLARLRDLPIEIDEEGAREALTRVLPLARRQRISAYDACYLELGLRLGIPIATLDEEMRSAVEQAGGTLFDGSQA